MPAKIASLGWTDYRRVYCGIRKRAKSAVVTEVLSLGKQSQEMILAPRNAQQVRRYTGRKLRHMQEYGLFDVQSELPPTSLSFGVTWLSSHGKQTLDDLEQGASHVVALPPFARDVDSRNCDYWVILQGEPAADSWLPGWPFGESVKLSGITCQMPSTSFNEAVFLMRIPTWKRFGILETSEKVGDGATPQVAVTGQVQTHPIHQDESLRESTSKDVLRILSNPQSSPESTQQAVLQAEVLDFDGDDRRVLVAYLRKFVLSQRESNEPKVLVVIASAIRKLVANLPSEELGTLNELLIPNSRIATPLEIELEVVKTVLRKLTWQPPINDDSEPELGSKLRDLASTYLNPRLLPREKYGATALNAVLSLLLLRSAHTPEVVSQTEAAGAKWFAQLACRRIERLLGELRSRVSSDEYPIVARCLVEFSSRLCHSL